MLEQYILNKLKECEAFLKKQKDQKKRLLQEEESCKNAMDGLKDNQDIGMEIFSPRNTDDTTKQKVMEIQNTIGQLHEKERQIEKEITATEEKICQYVQMLDEIKNRINVPYTEAENKSNKSLNVDKRTEDEINNNSTEKFNGIEDRTYAETENTVESRMHPGEKNVIENRVELQMEHILENENNKNNGNSKNNENSNNNKNGINAYKAIDAYKTYEEMMKNISNRLDKCIVLSRKNQKGCEMELTKLKHYISTHSVIPHS